MQRALEKRSVCNAMLAAAVALAGCAFAAQAPAADAPAEKPIANAADSADANPADGSAEAPYETIFLRGKVAWLAEALKRRYGVSTDEDAERTAVVLESVDRQLYPIIKDFRGRAFFLDKRLLGKDLGLIVRRHKGSPYIQIVKTYSFQGEKPFELDYWCDICAIPMYELKECECCQGPIRLRERPVEKIDLP